MADPCCTKYTSIYISELLPLWSIATTRRGGLGWQISTIGIVSSVAGAILIPCQLFLYPTLSSKFGPVRLFLVLGILNIPLVPLFPSSQFLSDAWPKTVFVSVCWIVQTVANSMAFTSSFILINNSCTASTRGAVNGAAMVIASFTKALGPITGAEIFAYSINHDFAFPFNVFLFN